MMRKKFSLALVGLLAGATISVGTGSPAYAQPHGCSAQDPVLAYVCSVIDQEVPDPQPWIAYYYDYAGRVVKTVYCTLWSTDPACQ